MNENMKYPMEVMWLTLVGLVGYMGAGVFMGSTILPSLPMLAVLIALAMVLIQLFPNGGMFNHHIWPLLSGEESSEDQ